ncbi:MAG TPA: ABC transporter permease [Gammaproteobacteria bacterium]|nr:ABC transporter permease [Gammaproteobacteria bacterium]
MTGILSDIRFGFRQLAAKPGFTTAAILTLALGIGANTAVFSLLNGYLLKPLPYPHAERLRELRLYMPKYSAGDFGFSVPMFEAIKAETTAFSGVAAYDYEISTLKVRGRAEEVTGVQATAPLFDVLSARPLLGRTFGSESSQPGHGHEIVLSYGYWQRVFGGNADVIGRSVLLSGTPFEIIGVMPEGFAFPDHDVDLWQPLTISPADLELTVRNITDLHLAVLGRLKPRVGQSVLRQQVDAAMARMCGALPAAVCAKWQEQGSQVLIRDYHAYLVGGISSTLLLLQGAVLLILLITCVNVANLLLSRILGRGHEIAMRAALGATRMALARQLLVEGLCLAAPGGAVGVGLGWLGLRYLSISSLGTGLSIFDIGFDWRVGLFALGAAVVTALLVSLLPLYHLSKTDMQRVLQEGGGRATGGGRGGRAIRNALVVSEITLATALLAGSGLLLHSFVNLTSVNAGFRKNDVLMARLIFPDDDDDWPVHAAYDEIIKQVRAIPGVVHAALASNTPFGGGYSHTVLKIPGYQRPPDAPIPSVTPNIVTQDYFDAFAIPILQGRGFEPQDDPDSRRAIIIDTRIAQTYFHGADPIGRQVRLPLSMGDEPFTIIGVVPSVKVESLAKATRAGTVYASASQFAEEEMDLVLNTSIPPGRLIEPLRKALAAAAPAVAVDDIQTMRQRLSATLRNKQTTMALLLAFAGIALALALVGVYGVMSYAVGQRRTECGVRLALGALPEDLSWLVLKDGLRLFGIGLTTGLGLAVIFGFVLSSRLFGVEPYDPLTLGTTVVVLAAVTWAACYLPARRAAKLDPAVAMMEQ